MPETDWYQSWCTARDYILNELLDIPVVSSAINTTETSKKDEVAFVRFRQPDWNYEQETQFERTEFTEISFELGMFVATNKPDAKNDEFAKAYLAFVTWLKTMRRTDRYFGKTFKTCSFIPIQLCDESIGLIKFRFSAVLKP